MKTLSSILTSLLLLPIIYTAVSAWEYTHLNTFLSAASRPVIYNMLSPVAIDVLFIIVALYLNIKGKFLENSIMCGTILASFILSVILNLGISFITVWLR